MLLRRRAALLLALLACALAKDARNPCAGRSSAGACTFGGGRYVVGTRLGAGAFGQVWTGSRRGDAAPSVALKFVDKVRNADVLPEDWPDKLRDMRGEIELLRALTHPNVLRLVETLEENDFIIIVTDLAAGDLASDLKARGVFRETSELNFVLPGTPAPEPLVRRMLHEVGSAVAYVHAQGIAHRDIKPDNILVSRAPGGAMVLGDLGISVMGREYERSLTRAVPAGAERDVRMHNELVDKDGVHDGDGDGVGDPECMPKAAAAAAAAAIGADGGAAPALADNGKRCSRVARQKHFSIVGTAGTFPYMAPEARDHWHHIDKIRATISRFTPLISGMTPAMAAEVRAEIARMSTFASETLQTEAVDVYSLGATAVSLMRGARCDLTGVEFSTADAARALAASSGNYSAALRAAVVSMIDPNPSTRARLADVFAALGVTPIAGLDDVAHPNAAPFTAPAGTCEAHRDCDDCASFPACAWCTSSRACVPAFGGACPAGANNRSKVLVPSACSVAMADTLCSEVNTCGSCAAQSSCAWCPSAGGAGVCIRYTSEACPSGLAAIAYASGCPASSAAGGGGAASVEAEKERLCNALVTSRSAPTTSDAALADCNRCASAGFCSFCGGDLTRPGTCHVYGGAADRVCSSFRSMVGRTCAGYGVAAQMKAAGKTDDCGGPMYGTKAKCDDGTWSCLWCESLGQCMRALSGCPA